MYMCVMYVCKYVSICEVYVRYMCEGREGEREREGGRGRERERERGGRGRGREGEREIYKDMKM